MSKARSLRDVLKSGDMCPYCRSTGISTFRQYDPYDFKCSDCGFQWDAEGIDISEDEPVPDRL